jgi:hypothetical protein
MWGCDGLLLAALPALKGRWRVSIKAQIKRLADLGLIPEHHATQLYKLYSAKGWTKEEPLDDEWPLSEPRLLRDSLNMIVASGLRTKADLAAVEFTMKAGDVENLTSLPPGWFSEFAGEVVQLRHDVTRSDVKPEGPGVIVQFTRK